MEEHHTFSAGEIFGARPHDPKKVCTCTNSVLTSLQLHLLESLNISRAWLYRYHDIVKGDSLIICMFKMLPSIDYTS